MTDEQDPKGEDTGPGEDDEHTRPTIRLDDDELANLVSRDDEAPVSESEPEKAPAPSLADSDDSDDGSGDDESTPEATAATDAANAPIIELPPVSKGDVEDGAGDDPVIQLPPVSKADADDEEKPAKPKRARRSRKVEDDEDDDDPFGADIDAMGEDEEDAPPKDPPEIEEDLLDKDALWVVRRLRAKGYEAYLTGGCVRDVLIGRSPKDFDVATAATPNQCRSVFRNCRLVGRRFRLAHVYFPGNKVIETATFRANPLDSHDEEELPEDLLLERDNVFGNIEEDARRRDLTINGLFYDPLAGKVIDFVNGREDIEAKLIRTIGDPQIRFQEDPVRIIRAIKFATRLEFDIEKETLQAMKDQVGELARCSPPRLQDEIVRLLTSGHAARAMDMCADIGVFQVLMSELNTGLAVELAPAPFEIPPPPEAKADDAKAGDANADDAKADDAKADDANADDAKADDAKADDAKADDAKADDANADDANADDAKAEDANADDAKVEDANADNANADDANAEDANAEDAKAEDAQSADDAAPAAADDAKAEDAPTGENATTAEVVAVAPTPPPPPATSEERNARFLALLASLDAVKERGAEITSAVAFATLLMPVWEAYVLSDQDEEKWLEELTSAWGDRLRLTRRDKDSLSILYGGLEQLNPANRHGSKARHLVGRPWFREALLLYIISNHAKGESLDDVAKWKAIATHYQKPYTVLKPGEREPRPRRARRSRSGSSNSGGGGGGRGRGRGRR